MDKNQIQSPGSKVDNKLLAKSFQGLLLPRNIIAQAVVMGYEFLVNAASIPCKLIMRQKMGERVFSPFAFLLMLIGYVALSFQYFLFAYAAVWNDFLGLNMFRGGVGISQTLYFILCYVSNPVIFLLFFLISKGTGHFKEKIREARKSEYSYSYYKGESKYFKNRSKGVFGFDLNDTNRRMLLEPWSIFRVSFPLFAVVSVYAFCVAQGYFEGASLVVINSFIVGLGAVGLSFAISSLCLFLEEFSTIMRIRSEALDLYDGEIYARQVSQKREQFVKDSESENSDNQSFIVS